MPNNPLLLSEGVDQETPRVDLEKLNEAKFEPGFWESAKEVAYSTTLDFMQQLTLGSSMGLLPDMMPGVPKISAEELNKRYGVNTFKDAMPEAQAILLVELQKQKNLSMQYSGLYSDSTFLGQNFPQWVGGIGGSLVNPLNAMPWGAGLPAAGATTAKVLGKLGLKNPNVALKAANSGFVQSLVTNGFGSVVDTGVRKALEERTGEELTWTNVLENIAAGTILGTGLDAVIDMAGTTKGKLPEEAPSKEMKAPPTPPEVEAGTLATIATRFEEGLPTNTAKVKDSFTPKAKDKLRMFTNEDLGEVIIAPDYHVLDLPEGFTEVYRGEGTNYRVGEKEFNTLEEANSYALRNDEKVKVTDVDGNEHVIDPIENDMVDEGKVDSVGKDFDNDVERSGHTKEEVENFEKFDENVELSDEQKRMEESFTKVKENLDEEIKSSPEPDEFLVAQKEKITEFEAKAKTEESVIKALTSCIIRTLK